jgi:hypothetical protein
MTKEEQTILEKIEKSLGTPDSMGNLTVHGICRLIDLLTEKYGKLVATQWFRGFLLHPDTARAWFGEEETCLYCGGNEIEDTPMSRSCAECGFIDNIEIYPYRYHLQRLVLLPTISEILAYYGRYV